MKIKLFQSKTFWTSLLCVNIVSCAISGFTGSLDGVIISSISFLSCYLVLYTLEIKE